jgi:DNA-binding PucR family transcriptional regulator
LTLAEVCGGTLLQMRAVAPTARTFELMAAIADRLALEFEETVAAMDAAVIEVVPEFGADAAIAAEVTSTNRGNWQRFLAVARQAHSPLSDAVPPEALDAARTVVRRGIDLDRIYEGYRRGHQVGLERWLACAYEIVEPGPELIGVTELTLSLAFRYIDQILGRVLAEAQREREEVIGGALARRTETIRLILDGAPIDPTAASRRLGYELDRRHTAVVLWAESAVAPHGALESAAVLLAQAAGSQRPLTLPAGTTTLWAWIGTPGEPAIEDLRSAIGQSPAAVRVAVGPTRRGIEGFRASHEAALTVHRLLLGNPASGRLASYRELEVTALAAHDPRRAAEFVATTLGPLAEDDPSAARLRETLRVYLEEADNAPHAAARLYTHRNTVLKRIARATELLGYPPGERRLAVELALELRRHLPPPAH